MTAKDGTNRGRPPKHGGYSGKELVPVMQEKIQYVMNIAGKSVPIVTDHDKIVIELLARNLAKIELFDRYLIQNGIFQDHEVCDKDGNVKYVITDIAPVLRIYWQAMNAAVRLCRELGLTPDARAKLGLQLTKEESIAEQIRRAKEEGVEVV